MSGVVVFNYQRWAVRYPELSGSITENQAEVYFEEAQLYCDNTACSPVTDLVQRGIFLGMITAHIAMLNAPINGQPASPLVGRISQATEGSVSVSAEADYPPGTAQWFMTTKYGAAFWTASQQFRTAFYVAGPSVVADPHQPFIFG